MAGPNQSDRPVTPKPGASPVQSATSKPGVPIQSSRPANGFAAKTPAAEPPRPRHPPSEPPEFDIDIDENGDGSMASSASPMPKQIDERLVREHLSRLLPVLAKLERTMAGKGKVLTIKMESVRVRGDKVFLGAKQIGDSDAGGTQVRIRLDALGYEAKKSEPDTITFLNNHFKSAGSLLENLLRNSVSASLMIDRHGILFCLHKDDPSVAFIKFPERSPEPAGQK